MTFNIDQVTGQDIQFGDRYNIEQILGHKNIYVSVDEIKTREFNQTSPYKGLKRFEPEDKDCFFGRDQFIIELAKELEQTNLLLLLGASGSGKSSVVRAGLLSWLQKKYGSRLVNLTFTPDQDPFESLYASLLRYYKQGEAQIARAGRDDRLTEVVTELRKVDSFWLIFIDQFEELFTTSQPTKREQFIANLVQLTKALKLLGSPQDCQVKIVATMRADFFDRLSPYPSLVKATDKHRPFIAEMQSDELRQAIEQPAALHGVVFETGLVEEIIKNVQGEAGYLPLLQYTLNLLWEAEQKSDDLNDRTLNISTYRRLGGVRGALQKRVEKIYQALPEAQRLAAQRIFLKLVEIGGDEEFGTEWKPVRRRAMRSEFDSELERRVLVKLIDENLLVSDRQPQAQVSTVEIAHEALLTSWETLNVWIKENRQAIAMRNRLNDDVVRWQAKKAEDELWTGSKLEQVLELKNDPTFQQVMGGFSSSANQFIDASLGLRDRIRNRQIRQARIITGVSISAVALVTVAGSIAILQRQEAIGKQQEAFARQLIAQAGAAKNQGLNQVQYSMLLAIEGMQRLNKLNASSIEGEEILYYGLSAIPPIISESSTKNYASIKARLVSTFREARPCPRLTNTNLFDLGTVSYLPHICDSPNRKLRVYTNTSMGASPGQNTKNYLAILGENKTKQIFAVLPRPQGSPFFGFSFSEDSKYLMVDRGIRDLSFSQGSVRVVNDQFLIDNQYSTYGYLESSSNNYGEISVDGNYAAKFDAKSDTLWILDKNQNVLLRNNLTDLINDSTVEAFNLKPNEIVKSFSSGEARNKLIKHMLEQQHYSFSVHNGKIIFAYSDSFSTWLWDLNERKIILIPDGFRSTDASLSGHGKYLVTKNRYNIVKIFKVFDRQELYTIQNDGGNSFTKFSPDEKYLAITSWANTVRIFEVDTWKEVKRFENKRGEIVDVFFSPDSKYIATKSRIATKNLTNGNNDYEVRLWSLQVKDLISDLCSRLTRNFSDDEWKQLFGEEPYQKTCPDLLSPEDSEKNPLN